MLNPMHLPKQWSSLWSKSSRSIPLSTRDLEKYGLQVDHGGPLLESDITGASDRRGLGSLWTLGFWGWVTLCWGGCSLDRVLHWAAFSPHLMSGIPSSPGVTVKTVSRLCPVVCWRRNYLWQPWIWIVSMSPQYFTRSRLWLQVTLCRWGNRDHEEWGDISVMGPACALVDLKVVQRWPLFSLLTLVVSSPCLFCF